MKFGRLSALLLTVCACVYAASFLGEGKYWRPRQNITFYLVDEQGGGFDIDIELRDLNTYLEGVRDAYVFVLGPKSQILYRQLLPDDGIVKNNYKYKDGVADEGMDFRYRAYHRLGDGANTDTGLSPHKKRNPAIAHPEKIKPSKFHLSIPDAGKGIYRVSLASCFDHYFTLIPSRDMRCAVYSGAGPLCVFGNQLETSYFYVSERSKQLLLGISEEIKPFNWSFRAETEGNVLADIKAGTGFYNFAIVKDAPKGKIVKLTLNGNTDGACLHLKGTPAIICEDEATAAIVRDGVRDPALDVIEKYAAEKPDDDSLKRICRFSQAFGFRDYDKTGAEWKEPDIRSSWWDFGDGLRSDEKGIPDNEEFKAAYISLCEKWAMYRYVMEVGGCTNQWAKILFSMAKMYKYSQSPIIEEALRYNVKRCCTKNSLGRLNPDRDSWKSGFEPDSGCIDNCIMAECMGHDCEYNLETDADMSAIYSILPMQEILNYIGQYYTLKTHLTASKSEKYPNSTYTDTFSETASNSRTRFYTHKSCRAASNVKYGSLWNESDRAKHTEVWPFLEEKPFVRSLEGRYTAVQTGQAYALFYTGPRDPLWNGFTLETVDGSTVEKTGWTEAGYGGWQSYQRKSNGFGFVWLRDFGPLFVSTNHNLMYTNNCWGVLTEPYMKHVKAPVDPALVAECLSFWGGRFDEAKRTFIRRGAIPHTPLKFERKIQVLDDGLAETLVIKATADCEFKELYESIPVPVDGRAFEVNGQEIKFAKAIMTPTHATQDSTKGFNGNNNTFKTDAVKMTNVNTGKSVTVKFDKEYDVITSTPFRYREIGLSNSGLSLKLPLSWKKGMEITVSYTAQ